MIVTRALFLLDEVHIHIYERKHKKERNGSSIDLAASCMFEIHLRNTTWSGRSKPNVSLIQ